MLLSISQQQGNVNNSPQLLDWVVIRQGQHQESDAPGRNAVPVLHERVHPDQSSGEEDPSHADVKARQRDFCC